MGKEEVCASTAPITHTVDPSSGRLSQVPTGGFPLTRAIAVAYRANWGAYVATISSAFPSLLLAIVQPRGNGVFGAEIAAGPRGRDPRKECLERNTEGPRVERKWRSLSGKKVRYGPFVVQDPRASELTSQAKSLDQNLEELWTERRRFGHLIGD